MIVPEFYPDLNNVYLDDPCYFTSVEAYIKYVVQKEYYSEDTPYAIENIRIIDSRHIRETLLAYKSLALKLFNFTVEVITNFFAQVLDLPLAVNNCFPRFVRQV